ncbi:MAG: hypothetical protein EXS64_09935 [Candidatus Latescibacteria bacterium]|nr:hypothetical protein [Candidatus Latescibacterota bacterium]
MSRYDIPAPTHTPGDEAHGFRIDAVTELPVIRARCYECTHLRTGAKVLHLHCDDEENLYAIAFRTPANDSTGVPHILEHCVLAGSEKYPVKDAFNELGKSTLNTFLNAFTWPDKTIYPVCSAVHTDYFNLAAVYTDLVLHPLITEPTFRQEGHHLELADLDDLDSDLTISGVVYNEMKGAYSSPDRVVHKAVQENLYPDNTYGVDSGGDPAVIPSLTYEQFRAFHRAYYAPGNARWYLYGDIPLGRHLAFISGQLEGFGPGAVDSAVREQPRWSAPRRSEAVYPIGAEDDPANKTFINVAWMVESMTKPEQILLFSILEEALVGSAAGPLRKALIDSGLGQDLSPVTGHDTDFLQTLFAVGLRGSEPDRTDQVESLILEALTKIAEDGLDPDLLKAAFHQIEFRGKEIVPPFPVMLLIRAASPANYGADPKSSLEFGKLIENVRARHAEDPDLFSRLIREWLLQNPHRLLSVVRPSQTLSAEQEAAFRAKMAERKALMTVEDLKRIQVEARALREAQETPDPPETLARLPKLNFDEVPRRVRTIPVQRRESRGVSVLEHEIFSNGIAYVDLAFDISDLDHETALHVPLLGQATAGLGAAGLDYARMATRIASATGGIASEPLAGQHLRDGRTFQFLTFRGKALERNLGELTAVLRDLLTASDATDHKRVRDLVLEARNGLFSRVIPSGHVFAYYRAGASLGLSRYRLEQWLGCTQVRFLSGLVRQVEQEIAPVAERLAALQRRIFTRDRLLVNVTGDPGLVAALRPLLEDLIATLPEGRPGPPVTALPDVPRSVGVTIPAQVNYVGCVLPVGDLLQPAAPAMEMLASILSSDFLYQKLRVQGGAYGGFSFYGPYDGLLPMLSYRDPHLIETLEVYDQVADFIRSDTLTGDLLERSKIGAIGGFDRILSPEQQGSSALRQHLLGVSDEDRKRFRDGLFEVTVERIRREALPVVEAALAHAPKAVIASKEAIEAANTKLSEPFVITTLE